MDEVTPDSIQTQDLCQIRAGNRQAFEQLFTRAPDYGIVAVSLDGERSARRLTAMTKKFHPPA
jgi:hypothetical protein